MILDGPQINATGGVESVLGANHPEIVDESAGEPSEGTLKRPRLLNADEVVLVTASELSYDDVTAVATYTGKAHLWQDGAEFHGDEILLDEATGNIRAQGGVRTRTVLWQVNDDTGLVEEAVTTGRAEQMTYDDALREATYTTDARVTGPRGDLQGETIRVHLQEDSKTLDRIEADRRRPPGNVATHRLWREPPVLRCRWALRDGGRAGPHRGTTGGGVPGDDRTDAHLFHHGR